MWDLPRPGLEPVSPALAGRFLTTAPPGKSLKIYFKRRTKKLPEDLSPHSSSRFTNTNKQIKAQSKTPYLCRLASKQGPAIERVSTNSLKEESQRHRDNTGKEIKGAKSVVEQQKIFLKYICFAKI